MGAASLVLGIIGLVAWLIPVFGGVVSIILGLIGIILAAVAKKNGQNATGGLVCSIVAAAIGLISFFLCGGCAACAICGAANSAANELSALASMM